MHMKKVIALLLTLVMAAALFAGCTGNEDENNLPVNIGAATPAPENPSNQDDTETVTLTREALGGTGMIAAGSIHNIGLRTNGTVVSGGHDEYSQRRVSDWSDVVFVAAGKTASVGVKADGSVLFAGEMSGSEAISGWSNVYMAAVGSDFVVALKQDGTLVSTGSAVDVSSWSDIVSIAAGDTFVIGLKSDGSVVSSSSAIDVSAWSSMVKIAAGADRAAAIDNTGKLYATIDTAAFDANSDYVCADIGAAGLVAVRSNGSVVAAMEVEADSDPLVYADSKDITAVKDAVAVSVGETHAVVMDKSGYAYAYGKNTDLQCDVATFNLRPYVENVNGEKYIRGMEIGTAVEEAKALIALFTGAGSVELTKADGTAASDTDIVATGMKATADGSEVGAIVILGDGNGDGAVTAEDAALVDKVLANSGEVVGASLRALQLSTAYNGSGATCTATDKVTINACAEGTGSIDQFGKKVRGTYTDKFASAYAANNDTVGYIEILGTNISYPIMFDLTGKWYYNDHTPAKESAESGSIYSYYYGPQKNEAITGHNSRPSGSMFHQLHHIQEYNMGKTTCDHTKYCGKELKDLPDLTIYSERVWDIYLYGEEARYEIFAMFETTVPVADDESVMEYIWWPYSGDYTRDTDEEIEKWLEEVATQTKEKSGLEFSTNVSADDEFLTILTCANEHSDANKGARLYYVLKKVDY